jgi:hypothetical protein
LIGYNPLCEITEVRNLFHIGRHPRRGAPIQRRDHKHDAQPQHETAAIKPAGPPENDLAPMDMEQID